MKNQYFGDVNDFKKYALLRELSSQLPGGLAFGWALTEDDGRSDGSRIGYLDDAESWRHHDPELFDFLRSQVAEQGVRDIRRLPASSLFPDGVFFEEGLSDAAAERDAYFGRLLVAARGAPLVFLDPDNGLGITATERGDRGSSKYIYPCEIRLAWAAGHSVLYYQHFPRRPREPFLRRIHHELSSLPALRTVVFFVTSHVVFVLFPRPEHEDALLDAASAVAGGWRGRIRVVLQSRGARALCPVEPGTSLRPTSVRAPRRSDRNSSPRPTRIVSLT